MTVTAQLDALHTQLPPERFTQRDGLLLCSPETTEEVAIITSFADRNALTIEIVGAGTKRNWGNPVAANFLLDTTRLDRLIEHTWQDLTCTVQAGCTWSEMQQALARHNQFVALDPLWPARATVGGIVATNDSGALRHRYGSLRDLIIGMTIVLADGTTARSGGKVVKNVAGYDLHKLMTGAFGTLGVIAEITFRLHPLPLHLQTYSATTSHTTHFSGLIEAIRDSHLLTQAVQLRGYQDNINLDIELNAHPEADQQAILESIAQRFGSTFAPVHTDVWQARESLWAENGVLVVKIGALPTTITHVADTIVQLGGTVVAQSFGIIYASFPPTADGTLLNEALQHFSDAGSVTILQRSSSIDASTRPQIQPDGLTHAIQQQFDPNQTLNPRRGEASE